MWTESYVAPVAVNADAWTNVTLAAAGNYTCAADTHAAWWESTSATTAITSINNIDANKTVYAVCIADAA